MPGEAASELSSSDLAASATEGEAPPRAVSALSTRRALATLVLCPAVLAVGWLALPTRRSGARPASDGARPRLRTGGLVDLAVATDCETADENILYWTRSPLDKLENVAKAEDCRQECEQRFFCSVWTWGKDPDVEGVSNVCFLKGLEQGEEPHALKKQGVVSGRPCRDSWGAPTTTRQKTTFKKVKVDGDSPVVLETPPSDTKVCGSAYDGLDFKSSVDLGELDHIGSWEFCLDKCELMPDCKGWSWGKVRGSHLTDKCFLHGAPEGEEIAQENNADVMSGKPCHALARNAGKGSEITLFCWALMLPHTYEQDLLATQYKEGMNIFACEKFKVYSNESVKIGTGLQSAAVDVNLTCSFGGEFGTALNTDIFITVWRKLIADADYLQMDWTVKADPDCVWFPRRLRAILVDHPEEDAGVFLNNCWRGMHGPIEVFSKNGVTAWGAGIEQCKTVFNAMCSGPCQWGEDMWADQCMWKVLHIRRDDVFELLIEDHCDPPDDDGWKTCHDATMVAYHPFKKEDEYRDCHHNSKAVAGDTEPDPIPEAVRGGGSDGDSGDD